jgi:5-(carboxyamino)imidazole ribonucleotide mutase
MAGLVGIIMGSASDSETMNHCVETLEEHKIQFDIIVASAHRDPEKVRMWVKNAWSRGNKVIIAAAGMSAALPGVVAAYTDLPVIGVPMKSDLNGLDSLLSISQMPRGVPVACMSIGKHGAVNAALFAKRILDSSKPPSYKQQARNYADDRILPGYHDQDLWRDD